VYAEGRWVPSRPTWETELEVILNAEIVEGKGRGQKNAKNGRYSDGSITPVMGNLACRYAYVHKYMLTVTSNRHNYEI